MAASKTDMANKALTLIGANPITSITDSANNARIINRVYDISLRSILSECKWNFATKRVLLSLSAETMAWDDTGENIVYARPSDVIRIFGTNDSDATWREEGDLIISNTNGLGLRYVYYLDVPSKYPSSFVEAFIDKLASDIAYMVLNSVSKGEAMLAKYVKISLPKAEAQNSQIGEQQEMKDDAWEIAKYGDNQVAS